MANIHVLERSNGGFKLVAHIPVPNTNNAAGVNHRTAMINSGYGGETVLPDGDGTAGTISTAEKTSIASGALYEVVELADPTQGGSNTTVAQINAWLDAWYAAKQAEASARFSSRLAQFGRTR